MKAKIYTWSEAGRNGVDCEVFGTIGELHEKMLAVIGPQPFQRQQSFDEIPDDLGELEGVITTLIRDGKIMEAFVEWEQSEFRPPLDDYSWSEQEIDIPVKILIEIYGGVHNDTYTSHNIDVRTFDWDNEAEAGTIEDPEAGSYRRCLKRFNAIKKEMGVEQYGDHDCERA